jgi:hypothetical protein
MSNEQHVLLALVESLARVYNPPDVNMLHMQKKVTYDETFKP